MKITGVVCEFNPLHKGHEYLLQTLRRTGTDILICVLSSNFVQRGEPAVADKYSRAKMALGCGADIVVELPYPYSASGAETFAKAGISILGALGINTLGFGSESGDLDALIDASRIVTGENFKDLYRRLCREGRGGASAFYEAYEETSGKPLPGSSNDILGIEYIKAAAAEGLALSFEPVIRVGNPHDSSGLEEGKFPSARALRELLLDLGPSALEKWMPTAAFEALLSAYEKGHAPARMKNLERGIISMLRLSAPGAFFCIAECSDGLGERLRTSAAVSGSLTELLKNASAKNYTDARIRRALLFALTGVAKSDIKTPPAYTTLLGANRKGLDYLSSIRKTCKIPIVTKPSSVRNLGGHARRQSELSSVADALWTLMLDTPRDAGLMLRQGPSIQSNTAQNDSSDSLN